MVYNSIWKDTNYTMSASATTYVDYNIQYDGDIIFQGRAYAAPLATTIEININRICQNYLKQEFTTTVGTHNVDEGLKQFDLYINGSRVEAYKFLYNWEYDWSWDGYEASLSYTDNRLPYGHSAYTYNTYVSADTLFNKVEKKAGTDKNVTGDYMLYYLNIAGGWQHFLIQGKVIEKDDINRFEITTYANNTTINHSKQDFLTKTTKSWELHTHFMSDSASTVFAKNIFRSPEVYLHNVVKDKIYPVVITDSSVEYKTFRNEKDLISYEINVESSQEQNYVR